MRPATSSSKDQIHNNIPPLKVNKESHTIKKASSLSSSTSLPSHRHPVIIYTHSPKIIHTHPKDFMALVQKLTGLSRSNEDRNGLMDDRDGGLLEEDNNNNKNGKINGGTDDNESSSVITTEENCCSGGGNGGGSVGDGQVNSCFMPPPIFEPPNPFLTNNIPVFTPNSADFLCSNQPFYNYTTESLLFSPNIRGSISSSSSSAPQGMNDFREF